MKLVKEQLNLLINILMDIGISLSLEKDHSRVLEKIVTKAQEITNADGGTIYTCTEDKKLKFEIMINKSMKIHLGASSSNTIVINDLDLYDAQGKPCKNMLAPWVAINRKTVRIRDAYNNLKFNLSGTKDFDKKMGYLSKSFLTVPMTNHLNEVIGVLQLVNAIDKKSNKVVPFSKNDQDLVECLTSQAAIIITNRQLIAEQKKLFDSLIQLIAHAIDEKSPYTGGHCRRVPIITMMLAKAACEIDKGPLKDFTMTEDELYELEVAAWLHDCGKITTPEAVVDKATKLEGILDGIHLIDTRFEVLKRDLIIEHLQKKQSESKGKSIKTDKDNALQKKLLQLDKEREFIRACNLGGEAILPEQIQAINEISKRKWNTPEGKKEHFLSEKEMQLLNIPRGTLSTNEREIINNHVTVTIKMLESLPYPKNLRNVPQLAGCHHEKLDGTGYPKGLNKDQMPLPARIIAIADIFEALTASDRPYKKAMPLSMTLSILEQMKLNGHIDPDLFDVFINKKIYLQYAQKYLNKESIDI